MTCVGHKLLLDKFADAATSLLQMGLHSTNNECSEKTNNTFNILMCLE